MLSFYITVDSKPLVKDRNGNSIIDFLKQDLIPANSSERPVIIDYYLVTKEDAMRPDLIAQNMYGYLDKMEGMLKFNGISNPFSIDENDVLYTFDIPSMMRNMRPADSTKDNRQDIRDQYITPEKKSTVDPALRSFDKRNTPRKASPQKGNQPALPPNYAAFGDTELQVRNGKIVFGPNVTKQDADCDKPLSKSEFIARLIKNRLSNK